MPGDAVYGQMDLGQTWADFACVPAELVAPKPTGLSWTEAASVPLAALTALQGLRDASQLQAGQSVLINGSTGAVGHFAVQIAKALGAHVTAVCSERNTELVRELGADDVIAYESGSFLDCGAQFDVLFDVVGNHSVWACRRVLKRDAVFTVVGGPEGRWLGPVPHIVGSLLLGMLLPQRVASFSGAPSRADLEVLTDWLETGRLRVVVSRTFPLEETAEAVRYQKEGRPAGKVALSMESE
jgi:NADPH:quinone reductase-like Zn-dependent oxidoreductase